jgi:outer membrane biosynthesis protein TonB
MSRSAVRYGAVAVLVMVLGFFAGVLSTPTKPSQAVFTDSSPVKVGISIGSFSSPQQPAAESPEAEPVTETDQPPVPPALSVPPAPEIIPAPQPVQPQPEPAPAPEVLPEPQPDPAPEPEVIPQEPTIPPVIDEETTQESSEE